MKINLKKRLLFLTGSFFLILPALFGGCSKADNKAQLNQSICIETSEGCSRIFNQGDKLPASYTETYSNMEDEQDSVSVTFYQGEDAKIEANHLIGNVDLPIKKNLKQGELSIQVTFMIDQSKKLTIVTKDAENGRQNETLVGLVN